MDTIKERVTQVLDSKGVLTRLKAELRANVFLAINDQDIQNGGVGLASKSDGTHREQLLQDPTGVVLVELVREFLRWCNLQFTLQVFDPEMQFLAPLWDRSSLEQHLGLADGDISSPLLLQLLSQHIAQQPLRQGSVPAYRPAQQVAAAAALDYTHSADSAAEQQQQQQESAAYAAAVAAKQRASKSGSYLDDVEEDLLTASMLHGQSHEEEEYAAVFVAAQPHSGGSGHDSDGSSSGASLSEQQQLQSRPMRGAQGSMDAALSQQQGLPPAAMGGEASESFGHLDRSPAAMSLELHGLDSPPPHHPAAAAAAAYATDRGSPGSDAAGSSGFSSPSASMEQQQGSIASPPAVAMPARLGALEPLAQLRPNKLAPLPAVKGPGGGSSSRSPGAPDELREELRRVGLLGTSAAGASPGASSSGSPQQSTVQQHGLYYGSGHDLESPGSSMAASAITSDVQPAAAAAAAAAGRAGLAEMPRMYGSAAGGVDLGDSDSSSDDDDDFGITEQRQLFEAARRQLSQSSQGGGLQVPHQQQRASATAAAAWQDDDDDSASDVEIPEDLSVPLEGLDAGDYSEVFRAGAVEEPHQQQPGAHNAAAAAAREQHGLSMDLHETGLSLSDRPGGIGLESADFRIDDDDF